MIIFFPAFTLHPMGHMHSYLGDTIQKEFLVNPDDAPAVLNTIGIRREAYERAQTEQEIKTLMFNDINKLKAYLSGPGSTDPRFKEDVRNRVNMKFQTSVINGISKQQWQKFTLKADDIGEYEKMKASTKDFQTGALYSSFIFDDENMIVSVEASNTVVTLDKLAKDGSVRVANMKGKDGKPMNYSEANLYGNIESNSNWVASDIFTWLKEAGFTSEQLITERKYEMGSKTARTDQPVTFKEGQRHALELLENEENLREEMAELLGSLGVIIGSDEKILTPIAEDSSEESNENMQDRDSVVKVAPQDAPTAALDERNEVEETSTLEIDKMVTEAIKKVADDKMISETMLIKKAQDLFPEYLEFFEKFLPNTLSFDMAKQKVYDAFTQLRNNPNAKVIEKHLADFTLHRMFLMNQMMTKVQKEAEIVKQNNGSLREELSSLNVEKAKLQGEASTATRDLNVAREEIGGLKQQLNENEIQLTDFTNEFEILGAQFAELQSERDELLIHRNENEKLRSDLASKDNLLNTLNDAYSNMTKAQAQIAETLDRVEKDSERLNQQNAQLLSERNALDAQISLLNEKLVEQTNVSVTSLSSLREELSSLNAEKAKLQGEASTATRDLNVAREEIGGLKQQLNDFTTWAEKQTLSATTEVPKEVVPKLETPAVNPVDEMSVEEANETLSEKIEEVSRLIPKIAVRRPNRESLKAATAALGKISDNLPKTSELK